VENKIIKVEEPIYTASFAISSVNPAQVTEMADALKKKYKNFEAHYTIVPGANRGEIITCALFRWDTIKEEFEGWHKKLQLSGGKMF
jgi:hypothetical protein